MDAGCPDSPRYFLYSPSSSYPKPYAALIDANGRMAHVWSNDEDQPAVEDDPPSFLRGWNHVEVDQEGNLLVIVPLQSVLKLDRESNLIWRAEIAAHHDLEVTVTGEVMVLAETPRLVRLDSRRHLILDNEIVLLDAQGKFRSRYSLYDILTTDPALADLINGQIVARFNEFMNIRAPHAGGPEVEALLETGRCSASKRRSLQVLRQLPGSPFDVLHANSLEVLGPDAGHMWQPGGILISLRNLDLVAVISFTPPRVWWAWGRGVLSGQHQPSVLPDGRFLIFDNGVAVGRSRILEVDPFSEKITWEYSGDPPGAFFTQVAGGCERLPNGNILATQAQAGRAIEVTRDHKVAWSWELASWPVDGKVSRVSIYRLASVPAEIARKIVGS